MDTNMGNLNITIANVCDIAFEKFSGDPLQNAESFVDLYFLLVHLQKCNFRYTRDTKFTHVICLIYRVSQKSLEFFSNVCISVNSLSLTMMFDFYESVAIQLSKTCLSLKIGQAVPKLWNKCQTLPKIVYGKIMHSYGPLVFYAKLPKILLTFGTPCICAS